MHIPNKLPNKHAPQAKTAAQSLRALKRRVRTEQQAVAAAQGRVVAQQAVVAQVKERRSYARLIIPHHWCNYRKE